MSIPNFFTACQELIVQSVDRARLIGRDVLQMQRSQLILGRLEIATIVNRPWSAVKRWGVCPGCKRSGITKRNRLHRQQCVNQNGAS
jgi:hypothetical protein